MICRPCREGAELYQAGEPEQAERSHGECPGSAWCDCQHGVPRAARM
jgi:hypothetical protein